jgi:CxxC-x17-CxxC domain-containing protein
MKKSFQGRSGGGRREGRGGGWGGERKFGGAGGWKKDRGGFDHGASRGEMHDAVCAGCGKDCQVPFRPNGRKPVYCNFCFKKEDAGGKSFERNEFGGGGERSFRKHDAGNNEIQDQLKLINDKLDAIIDALNDE